MLPVLQWFNSYQGKYNTCGIALIAAGAWLDVLAAGAFLSKSCPEYVEPVTGESTLSGSLSAIMEVLDAGGSADTTPFTSTGADGS